MADIFELVRNEQLEEVKAALAGEEPLVLVNKKQENFVHFLL